jgi:hypothetical protein
MRTQLCPGVTEYKRLSGPSLTLFWGGMEWGGMEWGGVGWGGVGWGGMGWSGVGCGGMGLQNYKN